MRDAFQEKAKPLGLLEGFANLPTSLRYVLEAYRSHVTPVQHMASSTWHLLGAKNWGYMT